MRFLNIMRRLLSLDDADFIVELYREALNREPDYVGFEHHLRLLRAGASKKDIAIGILLGGESVQLWTMNGSPVVTMSCLGHLGRFGNQLFEYSFLKIYAKRHGFRVETPVWIGHYLFGHRDPTISIELPQVFQTNYYDASQDPVVLADPPYRNVDLFGCFQVHTSFHRPYREYYRSLFQPVGEAKAVVERAADQLRMLGRTVVAFHIRRTDYLLFPHVFFVPPNDWYKGWLHQHWHTLDQPVLFIATDEPDTVLPDFAEYNPVTSERLGASLPVAPYYPDFYLLSQSDVMLISNSTFSFSAAMMNERATTFLRPSRYAGQFVPFDPWDSAVGVVS
ncbi:DUF4214 domain-containing protein [Paenibacillus flagellatus]|uniref:DUF4214 domain-containing protein n=1 Tax=Paenibacillus flagellatus TaxID=2211139 RepID=A0A2V5JYY8_9BACL|nr:DUF4214 domain-containing protein [Paenibacillus flagellatus]PYI52125.1 hypothetical protein DLM86_21845 [Paenibacillus flagellatus]